MVKTIAFFCMMAFFMICLFSCGTREINNDDDTVMALGKIISRRLGLIAADRYPELAGQIAPVAKAVSEAVANGDDLITILKIGLNETPYLDPMIKKDIEDLIGLVEVNNIPEVYQEVAGAFLEGVSIYSTLGID